MIKFYPGAIKFQSGVFSPTCKFGKIDSNSENLCKFSADMLWKQGKTWSSLAMEVIGVPENARLWQNIIAQGKAYSPPLWIAILWNGGTWIAAKRWVAKNSQTQEVEYWEKRGKT